MRLDSSWLTLSLVIFDLLASQEVQAFEHTWKHYSFVDKRTQNEESALDPTHQLIDESGAEFASRLDVNSKFLSKNWGAYEVSLQLSYDEERRSQIREEVLEAFGTFDVSDSMQIMIGRKIQDWGKSYYRNPSAILTPDSRVTDINDLRSARTGFDSIQFDYIGDLWNFALVYTNSLETADPSGDLVIVRPSVLVKGWELSLILARGPVQGTLLGGGFTKVLNDQLELHGEFLSGDRSQSFQNQLLDRRGEHFIQSTLGTLLSLNMAGRDVRWITEIYFNSLGASNSEWKRIKDDFRSMAEDIMRPDISQDQRTRSIHSYREATLRFDPKNLSRLTLFTTLDNLPTPVPALSYRPVFIYSLLDRGFIGVLSADFKLKEQLSLFANYNRYGGAKGSVFQTIPLREESMIGITSTF